MELHFVLLRKSVHQIWSLASWRDVLLFTEDKFASLCFLLLIFILLFASIECSFFKRDYFFFLDFAIGSTGAGYTYNRRGQT